MSSKARSALVQAFTDLSTAQGWDLPTNNGELPAKA